MRRSIEERAIALKAAVASHGKRQQAVGLGALFGASSENRVEVPNDPVLVVEAAEHYCRWLEDGTQLVGVDEVSPDDEPVPPRLVAQLGETLRMLDRAGVLGWVRGSSGGSERESQVRHALEAYSDWEREPSARQTTLPLEGDQLIGRLGEALIALRQRVAPESSEAARVHEALDAFHLWRADR